MSNRHTAGLWATGGLLWLLFGGLMLSTAVNQQRNYELCRSQSEQSPCYNSAPTSRGLAAMNLSIATMYGGIALMYATTSDGKHQDSKDKKEQE